MALLTACPILSTNEEANVATRSSALPGVAGDLTRFDRFLLVNDGWNEFATDGGYKKAPCYLATPATTTPHTLKGNGFSASRIEEVLQGIYNSPVMLNWLIPDDSPRFGTAVGTPVITPFEKAVYGAITRYENRVVSAPQHGPGPPSGFTGPAVLNKLPSFINRCGTERVSERIEGAFVAVSWEVRNLPDGGTKMKEDFYAELKVAESANHFSLDLKQALANLVTLGYASEPLLFEIRGYTGPQPATPHTVGTVNTWVSGLSSCSACIFQPVAFKTQIYGTALVATSAAPGSTVPDAGAWYGREWLDDAGLPSMYNHLLNIRSTAPGLGGFLSLPEVSRSVNYLTFVRNVADAGGASHFDTRCDLAAVAGYVGKANGCIATLPDAGLFATCAQEHLGTSLTLEELRAKGCLTSPVCDYEKLAAEGASLARLCPHFAQVPDAGSVQRFVTVTDLGSGVNVEISDSGVEFCAIAGVQGHMHESRFRLTYDSAQHWSLEVDSSLPQPDRALSVTATCVETDRFRIENPANQVFVVGPDHFVPGPWNDPYRPPLPGVTGLREEGEMRVASSYWVDYPVPASPTTRLRPFFAGTSLWLDCFEGDCGIATAAGHTVGQTVGNPPTTNSVVFYSFDRFLPSIDGYYYGLRIDRPDAGSKAGQMVFAGLGSDVASTYAREDGRAGPMTPSTLSRRLRPLDSHFCYLSSIFGQFYNVNDAVFIDTAPSGGLQILRSETYMGRDPLGTRNPSGRAECIRYDR